MRAIFVVATLFALALPAQRGAAQTWSVARARPALWQISSVDATGEQGWPYGSEDVAGDGADSFEADEAGVDLRTLYADADADELWIRAYVSATSAPPGELVAFFFLDSDDRDSTGGDAEGMQLWADWDGDPSAGGYERAVGVRGDGTLIGAFEWRGNQWMALTTMPSDVRIEIEVDRDPIRIGSLEHGYVQLALSHDSFGLTASCNGNIFVRLWHDGNPQRSFGDDDDEQAACRAPSDSFGDPVVLRRGECSSDAQCPAGGDCVDGQCVFGYECTGDAECRSEESCESGVCRRTPGDACTSAASCDGLVCADGECVACTETGDRACGGDAACAPDGTCRGPGGTPAGTTPGKVRGGAFECAARPPGTGTGAGMWLLLAVTALLAARRGRRHS